jgi:two-component system response regulator YesN
MWRQEEIGGHLDRFRQTHAAPIEDTSWHVRQLVNCIHEELFDPGLNVKTLKSRCRVRDHNVSCRFKHEVGRSIKEYLESLRLDAATLLLELGVFSAFEVAQAVGYCHPQTFYRAFIRRFRCTPGDFRRRFACTPGDFRRRGGLRDEPIVKTA